MQMTTSSQNLTTKCAKIYLCQVENNASKSRYQLTFQTNTTALIVILLPFATITVTTSADWT